MSKLKLAAIEDDKPVRLTIEIPAAVHRDLAMYAEALGQGTGKSCRSWQAHSGDARTFHGDRSRFRQASKDQVKANCVTVLRLA